MSRERADMGQAAENAAEIIADVKAEGGRFRELEQRYVCRCSGAAVVLARLFVGKDDDGVLHTWLWVAGHSTKSKKIPPVATIVATRPGEIGWGQITQCPRCRIAYLFMPGYGVVNVMTSNGSGEHDLRVVDG